MIQIVGVLKGGLKMKYMAIANNVIVNVKLVQVVLINVNYVVMILID